MTEVSTEFLRGAFAEETGLVPVFLLTITHSGLSAPIYISSDPTERLAATTDADVVYGTVSRGTEYVFFPFRLKLPGDGVDGPTPMSLELDNVRREYIAELRAIVGPPTVKTEIVLSTSPDLVERQWPNYLLVDATYDAQLIKCTLALETLVREPYPALKVVPSYFPGVF